MMLSIVIAKTKINRIKTRDEKIISG